MYRLSSGTFRPPAAWLQVNGDTTCALLSCARLRNTHAVTLCISRCGKSSRAASHASSPAHSRTKASAQRGKGGPRQRFHAPPRTHVVNMSLGNGLSAAVQVSRTPGQPRTQLKKDLKIATQEEKTQRPMVCSPSTSAIETTSPCLTFPAPGTAVEVSTGERARLLLGEPRDVWGVVHAQLHDVVQHDTFIDDYAQHCCASTADAAKPEMREMRRALVDVYLPFLFELAETVFPVLASTARVAAMPRTVDTPTPQHLSRTTCAPASLARTAATRSASEEAPALVPTDTVPTVPLTAEQEAMLVAAQEALTAWLIALEETAAHTARRYEPALPATIVAALWMHVMPTLHSLSRIRREKLPHQWQSYRRLRQHLAGRVREVVTLMPPTVTARVLTRIQQCGALADDVLGPIATRLLEVQRHQLAQEPVTQAAYSTIGGGADRSGPIAMNHTLFSHEVHPVRLASNQQLLFQGADAVTMTRLIGRASVPGHFQLHTLVHTVLLPVVREELHRTRQMVDAVSAEVSGRADGDVEAALVEWSNMIPPRSALLDLTRCFINCAVSGQAADDLIVLWAHHARCTARLPLGDAVDSRPVAQTDGAKRVHAGDVPQSLRECSELLRLLAMPSHPSSASTATRHASREVAAEAYLPLAEHVCAQVRHEGQLHLAHTTAGDTNTPGETVATASAPSPSRLTVDDALQLLTGVLGVDCVHWIETYHVTATLAWHALTQRLASGPTDAALIVSLRSYLRTLRRRGDRRLPHHPLHTLAAHTLLYSAEAERDARTAGEALVSVVRMAPRAVSVAPAQQEKEQGEDDLAVAGDDDVDGKGRSGALSLTEADGTTRVLALLRLHDQKLPLTAFAAALTYVPLEQLSLDEQSHMVQHLAASASALSPSWLAAAIAACARGLPTSVLDPISVQRLCSRFTAHDTVRRLTVAEASAVLLVVSRDAATDANCALSKAALLRHVSVRLRREVDQLGAQTQVEILADLPALVHALQQSHSFFVYLFSRVCRVLLGQVEQAPWSVLLPAFAAVADEYTRRSPAQSRGTVFADVWQLLRDRVMEAASSSADAADGMALDDVLQAVNAFAALDVQDRPLFSVLTHALSMRCADALARTTTIPPGPLEASATNTAEGEAMTYDVPASRAADDDDDDDKRVRQVRVALGQHLTAHLTPSAVAALTGTLVQTARVDGHGGTTPQSDAVEGTLLSWLLVATRQTARDMYPIDIVCLMPALMRFLAEQPSAAEVAQEGAVSSQGRDALTTELAYRAYDACRAMFLLMYEDPVVRTASTEHTSGDTSSAETTSVLDDADVVTDESARQALAEKRAHWPAKALASVRAVPSPLFADILNEMTTCGWLDKAVSVACAKRICVRRVCKESLPAQTLVDVTMSLSVQLHAPAGEAAAAAAATSAADSSTVDSLVQTEVQRFMPIVLNALWERVDELTAEQIDALLRFLRHQYREKLDEDFVDRLAAQRASLLAAAAAATATRTVKTNSIAPTQSTPAPADTRTAAAHRAQREAPVVDAEDLFTLM